MSSDSSICRLAFLICLLSIAIHWTNGFPLKSTPKVNVIEKAIYTSPTGGPAFLTFLPRNPTDGKIKNMIVSTFDGVPYVKDYVYVLQGIDQPGKAQWIALNRTSDLYWPNEPFYISPQSIGVSKKGEFDDLESLFGRFGSVLVPSGFLVPTKNYGGIWQYTFQSDPSLNGTGLSANLKPILNTNQRDGNEWFYHRVRYVPELNKGNPALLTCRMYLPTAPWYSQNREMVLLTPPDETTTDGQWKENVISKTGCDIFFRVLDLDGDGNYEILTADFFQSQLNLFWVEKGGNWLNPSNIKQRTIDNSIGMVFDLVVQDLDYDGQLEMIVTNHMGENKGALFIYKVPKDIYQGEWIRETIYDNFPIRKFGISQAAPGIGVPFKISPKKQNSPWWIAVSGDGAEYAYLFAPSSNEKSNSTLLPKYELVWQNNFKGTVGTVYIDDVDNNGVQDMFVCSYDNAQLIQYEISLGN